jgi:hypothetical protein
VRSAGERSGNERRRVERIGRSGRQCLAAAALVGTGIDITLGRIKEARPYGIDGRDHPLAGGGTTNFTLFSSLAIRAITHRPARILARTPWFGT